MFVEDDHAAVPEGAPGGCVAAADGVVADVLGHGGAHVVELRGEALPAVAVIDTLVHFRPDRRQVSHRHGPGAPSATAAAAAAHSAAKTPATHQRIRPARLEVVVQAQRPLILTCRDSSIDLHFISNPTIECVES